MSMYVYIHYSSSYFSSVDGRKILLNWCFGFVFYYFWKSINIKRTDSTGLPLAVISMELELL